MNTVESNAYEVSLEASAGLERRLTVRVPNAEIERAIDARLKQVGKTARLKGFRPGKVPQKVVRRYYGGQVRDEVLADVIRTTFSRAIAERKLNPAGGPRIEPLTGEGGGEHFTYRATFEVYPEIKLGPLSELEIEVPSVTVEEEDLDAMIEKLRGQRATWHEVGRKAAEGDRVTVDFTGTVDGEPFEGGSGKGVGIVVGPGQVLEEFKGFNAALRGVAAGESVKATVVFPQDYPTKSLAGKTAEFAIDVKKVEERRLPELDDKFAESFGIAGGAGSLRGEVRKSMERELKERLRAVTKRRVFDALIQANRIVVPRSLVEEEVRALQADVLRYMGSTDPNHAPPRERFEPTAQRRVTVGLLVEELMREHKIEFDQARVDERIKELAAPYENPDEAARFYRSDRGMMAEVKVSVVEDQVVDLILSQARCTTRSMAFKDFMSA